MNGKTKQHNLAEIIACCIIVTLTCVFMSMQQRHFRFISENQLATTMNLSRPQYLNVVLGNNFAMRGLTQTATKNGVVLDINWQSLKDQDLHYYNAVHALDVNGDVLNYCDYEQDEQKRVVKKNQFWHDHVLLSNDQLKDASSLGITVYQQIPLHQLEIRNADTDKFNRIIVALDKRPPLAR